VEGCERGGISDDKPQESFNQYKFYQKYYKYEKSGICGWGADAMKMGYGGLFWGDDFGSGHRRVAEGR
jgi:hypothetical protein